MSTEKSYSTLKAIWDQVALKFPDGNKYILFKSQDDLVYLYCTGFVDENKNTLKSWIEAFKEAKLPNGTYKISEAEWMSKVSYHYNGPTIEVFDPLSLADGDYSEADMAKIIKNKILPSVYFTAEEFQKIFDEAKTTFFINGSYRLNQSVKEDLKQLIEMYPSPAYVRALGILEAKLGKDPKSGANSPQKSGFALGPSASQTAAQKLADILSRK